MASGKDHFGQDWPAGGRTSDDSGLLRIPVNSVVTLDCGNGVIEATAVDISENGVKIELSDPPPRGPISIKMIGLPTVSAEIKWRTDHRAGVRFARPIPRKYLTSWLQAHGFDRLR